jgi:DNA repair exonuclease SbcCD ATPase subunit
MKIKFKNFKCYDDGIYDFGDKGLSLISGPSGVGKSSILEGIHFALFGTGKKVTAYGKTSCVVELEFDGMKIVRTKRPNRVVVNDIYEDQVAQDIINKKFGETFSTTGYVAQNALNSFMLKNPIEKLDFLEKFAFRDIDIGKIKKRCKGLIDERKNSMIAITSQMDFAVKYLDKLENPDVMEFPIRCKRSQRENAIKNENIKLKNSKIRIKRTRKVIVNLKKEINDIHVLNATLQSKEDTLDEIILKRNTYQKKLDNINYCGDGKLDEYEYFLDYLVSQRELIGLEEQYNKDTITLNKMKITEKQELQNEILNLKNNIWKEYTKKDVNECIQQNTECINDIRRLESIQNNIRKYQHIVSDELNDKKNKLQKYQKELENKDKIYRKLVSQQELYKCPCCDVVLKLKDNILEQVGDMDDTSNLKDADETKKELDFLKYEVSHLQSEIPDYQNKLLRKNEMLLEIKNINDTLGKIYEEIPTLNDIEGELLYMKEYNDQQCQFEKRILKLEKKIENKIYSSSCKTFENNINILLEKIKNLQNKKTCQEINLNEDELRTVIHKEKNNRRNIEDTETLLDNIKNEINRYKNHISEAKETHIEKYKKIEDEHTLESRICSEEIKMSEYENKKNKCEETIVKIEKWKQYNKSIETYQEWELKVKNLKLQEKDIRNHYASATMLKDKILEAESIAMLNIIESINIHAQIYLDAFFLENPIIVKLLPFKKTKKNTKPQINVEIEYKGMECDLNMLSGGELSRVILAYTLALGEMFNTPLLMLDECTASLDQDLTTVVFNGIRKHFNGKLVLIIAHQIISGTFDKVVEL